MAEWPTVEDVKLSLGVDNTSRDAMIAAAVGAAIEQVAVDLGYEQIEVAEESPGAGSFTLTGSLHTAEEDDSEPVVSIVPTYSLNQAALILAVMAVKAPDAPYGVAAVFDLGALRVAANHPTYQRMLTGHRQRFGVG